MSGGASGRPPTAASRSFPVSWRVIAESVHFMVQHDAYHSLVRVTRISDAFPDVAALQDAHRWLLKTFSQFQRAKIVLVWDGRRGKLRNDPEFETAIKQVLPAVTEGWREFVSINNTPVMKVQFFRWVREGITAPIRAFNDEREAMEYALDVSGREARNSADL